MAAAWPLIRLYAHSVAPSGVAQGGAVATTKEIQAALLDAHVKAGLDQALPVSFAIDPATRTCAMRDRMMAVAFGDTSAANKAADDVARRLAAAMDQRSKRCLLVISMRGEKKTDARHIEVWTFPRDEAFQLSTKASRIDLLDDVFSRSSRLRKAASFEGRNLRTQFLSGRVLDFQANASDRFIADY